MPNSSNALHEAAAHPHGLTSVQFLTAAGHHVNEPHSEFGTRPVEFSAQSGSLQTVQYLIEYLFAKIDADQQSHNLIFWALQNHYSLQHSKELMTYVTSPQIVEKFKDGTTLLHAAAAAGNIRAMEEWVAANPHSLFESNQRGETALYWAALASKRVAINFITEHELFNEHVDPIKFDPMWRGMLQRDKRLGEELGNDPKHFSFAINLLNDAIQFFNSIVEKNTVDYLHAAQCYNKLGTLHSKVHPSDALSFYQKAVYYYEKNGTQDVPAAYFKIAMQHENNHSPDNAIKAYEAARAFCESQSFKTARHYRDLMTSVLNIGNIHLKQEKLTLQGLTEAIQMFELGLSYYAQLQTLPRDENAQDASLEVILNERIAAAKQSLPLVKEAKKWGLECINTEHDGNCFFKAALDQMAKDLGKDDMTVHQMRYKTAAHMRRNQETYEVYMNPTPEMYLRFLLKDGSWADHTAIVAAAREFNISIVIIMSDGLPQIIKRPDAKGILYFGFQSEGHYQALAPTTQYHAEHSIQELIDKTNVDDFIEKFSLDEELVNSDVERINVQRTPLGYYTVFRNSREPVNPTPGEYPKMTFGSSSSPS